MTEEKSLSFYLNLVSGKAFASLKKKVGNFKQKYNHNTSITWFVQ